MRQNKTCSICFICITKSLLDTSDSLGSYLDKEYVRKTLFKFITKSGTPLKRLGPTHEHLENADLDSSEKVDTIPKLFV